MLAKTATKPFTKPYKQRTLKTSLVYSAVLSALTAAPLYAAEDEENVSAIPISDVKIEHVMVTSRKRAESIIAVPMSISTVSALEIADRNLLNKEDVYRSVAGAASPRGQLILRGLAGSNDSTPETTSSFTDGIPYNFSDLYDVERIEILRGPQGTLYGSNAIGGTVRVITKKPQLDEFEVKTSIQVNSQKRTEGEEKRIYGAVNIPIADTVAMRITGSYSDDPKATTNIQTGVTGYNKDTMIRSQILWQPEDDLTLNLSYILERSGSVGSSLSDVSTGFNSSYLAELTPNADAPFGYDVALGEREGTCNDMRPSCFTNGNLGGIDAKYARYEALDTRDDDDVDLIALTIEDEDFLGLGSLSYAGSYRNEKDGGKQNWSRTDGQDMFKTWIIDDYSTNRITHELRLQSNDTESNFDWTVGYFYDKDYNDDGANRQLQYHDDTDEAKAIASYLWGDYWGYLGFEYQSVDGSQTQMINTVAELGNFYWNDDTVNYEQRSESYWAQEKALFGEASYTFDLQDMGEIEVTGGIRFYDLADSSRDVLIGIWNGGVPTISESAGDESGNRKKVSLSWRPHDDMSVYALYSEGYRPGGNNLPALPQSCVGNDNSEFHSPRYSSDEINNYEMGYKASLFERKVSVAMAVYRIDWTGVQAPIRMSCGFSFTANAASARTQGFEFESKVQITDDLSMTFNYGYTSAEMTADVAALDVQAGDEMTMVPKYNGYLAFDQGFEIFDRQAYIRADVAVYGKYNSHFKGNELDLIPGYEVVNLSTRLEVAENINLSMHVNNLFDTEVINYKRAAGLGYSGANYIRYGEDRNVSLRMDYSF
ncbi:MAG: iron complex outermembrane receptor protein [Phenylobacterium sp.]|jgi:iron complex outermembrane receptor protein